MRRLRGLGTTILFLVFWGTVIAAVWVQARGRWELEATEALGFQGQWTPIDEALAIERRCREWEAARAEALQVAGW